MITRDVSKAIVALDEVTVITCSTGVTTGTGRMKAVTTSGDEVNGFVIDRLSPELGANYNAVDVFAYINSTVGTTWANSYMTLDVWLQHGTSGTSGDMANLSSGRKATARTISTTVMTTPMGAWSTGKLRVQTDPATFDLTGAYRYLMPVMKVSKNQLTSETSGYESARAGMVLVFREADYVPPRANTTGAFSTSTSTST